MSAGPASRPRLAAVAMLVLGVTLTGCTGNAKPEPIPTPSMLDLSRLDPDDTDGNGLWLLRDEALSEQIVRAVGAAEAVRVRGSITEKVLTDNETKPGRRITIDVQRSGDDLHATITADRVRAELTVRGSDAYISGNAALAQRVSVPEVAEGAVCVTVDDELIRDWAPLSDPEQLLEELLLSTQTPASGLEPARDAAQTELVFGEQSAPLGRASVARTGPPLPSELVIADDAGSAELRFDGWNDAVTIEAPERLSRPCD